MPEKSPPKEKASVWRSRPEDHGHRLPVGEAVKRCLGWTPSAEPAWTGRGSWTGLKGLGAGDPNPLSNWGHHPPSPLGPQMQRRLDLSPKVSRAQQPGLGSHLLHFTAL